MAQDVGTRYGTLLGATFAVFHDNGSPCEVWPGQASPLETPLGRLVPQHTGEDLRKPRVEPVAFYPDGTLRSLPLETQTRVSTPLGEIPAELVSFHPSGTVRRVFPLNGKLSGPWTWEDEQRLAEPLALETPAGRVEARLICVHFHPSGVLRSLTLWRGEEVEVDSPLGRVRTRLGLAFHADGALRSLEPAEPMAVHTPIGTLRAFDSDALGVSGDANSLVFAPDGKLEELASVDCAVAVSCGGQGRRFAPGKRQNLCEENVVDPVPLRLRFESGLVRIGDEPFELDRCTFRVERQIFALFSDFQGARGC
ncbi:hypothetical protein PCS_00126 [Desulfocurvibacter africanus PCS]|uniref:MORN repeat protein n=1 Tax=Desulfocurvibacter africanus PCS TaxID=1262666 RepID=M5Q3I3_DESAF|nr:hypothetical protein [Desulfocurvibacter africanus]EMG38498.1 hypothetical protein PCS_00126 [Desulfocurvibacter africanus PCS]